MERAISWTRLRRTVPFFADTLTIEDAEVLNFDYELFIMMLQKLADVGSWEFLQCSFTDQTKRFEISELEQQCIQVRDHLQCQPPVVLPKPFGRHRVLLHLISGRRRRGDVQFYLDALAVQQHGFVLDVISLDIVIHRIAVMRPGLTHATFGLVQFAKGSLWQCSLAHLASRGPKLEQYPWINNMSPLEWYRSMVRGKSETSMNSGVSAVLPSVNYNNCVWEMRCLDLPFSHCLSSLW
jgi:hypothetical protein